jgi:dynein heavy chain, axonemal
MYDKKVICDKYLNRGIPLVRLDEKFIFFTQIINDLENVKPYHDIKAIRINLRPLIQSIIEHAVEWRNTLGNMVSDRTNIEMVRMNVEFKVIFFTYFPRSLMEDMFFFTCERLTLFDIFVT